MANQESTPQKPRKKKKIVPAILIIILVAGAAFGIREYIFYQHYDTTDDAQVDGNINPVVARVGGYVKEIRFKDNQFVHKGDTLVILDDRDYKLKLEEAKAGLTTSHARVAVSLANVSSTSASVAPAEANVTAAEAAYWKINQDYKRYQKLFEGHAITQSQFDAIKAKQEAAKAQLAAAQKQVAALNQQVQSTKKQVGAAKSNIAGRQAAIDFAKLQLSYTVITAPVSGIVSERNIQIGQLVQAGQSMFAIVNTSEIYVTANFKETQLAEMKIGQKVAIDVDAYPDKEFKGTVTSFSGATGAKFSLLPPNNATGNFVKVVQRLPVRITFDSLSPEWRFKLHPGLSVNVKVKVR